MARTQVSTRRRRFDKRRAAAFRHRPPAAYIAIAVVVALAAACIGFWRAGGANAGVWWEIGKAGLGVLAIAVLGGVTAAAFRQREREREHESRKDDERAKFVSELWDAYHKAKAVRRELTGAGIKMLLLEDRRDFDEQQRETLAEQMGDLNDAQLIVEKLIRTVRRERREVFTRSEDPHLDYGDRLLLLLTVAEKYVRKVLNNWEEQFQPDEKYRGRMLGFLDKADKPLGLNRMTVALERTADIVYSLRSESRSGYVESADREEDCDLWDDGLGVGKGKKSERIKKPPECAQATEEEREHWYVVLDQVWDERRQGHWSRVIGPFDDKRALEGWVADRELQAFYDAVTISTPDEAVPT